NSIPCLIDNRTGPAPPREAATDTRRLEGRGGARGSGGNGGSARRRGHGGSARAGGNGASGGSGGSGGSGAECQNGDQCATDLCDPQSLSCTESDCSGPAACARGICLEQVVDSGNGLCATACTLTGGCSGTDTCVIDTLGDGYCVPSGSGGH